MPRIPNGGGDAQATHCFPFLCPFLFAIVVLYVIVFSVLQCLIEIRCACVEKYQQAAAMPALTSSSDSSSSEADDGDMPDLGEEEGIQQASSHGGLPPPVICMCVVCNTTSDKDA